MARHVINKMEKESNYMRMLNDSSLNETDNDTYYELLKQPIYMIITYSSVYSAVFMCALIGNFMVVIVVIRNKNMQNVTNYFIVNLAVADVLVAIFCVPITLLANLYNGWRFGPLMCRVTPYLQGVSVCASVNTLAAIALDRYLAICHTIKLKLTSKSCKLIIVCIWIVSLIVIVPWAIYYTHEEYKTSLQVLPVCYQKWPSKEAKKVYFVAAIFLFCYTIPLVLIVVCYLLIGIRVWRRTTLGAKNSSSYIVYKSKVKVVKMLAVVVIMFALSWLPLYVVNFKIIVIEGEDDNSGIYEIIIPVAQWLGSSNSGMNPIIYCFFSKKFRNGFKDVITCFRSHKPSSQSSNQTHFMTHYKNGNGKSGLQSAKNLCPSHTSLYCPVSERSNSSSYV